jgi:hypothetical protein
VAKSKLTREIENLKWLRSGYIRLSHDRTQVEFSTTSLIITDTDPMSEGSLRSSFIQALESAYTAESGRFRSFVDRYSGVALASFLDTNVSERVVRMEWTLNELQAKFRVSSRANNQVTQSGQSNQLGQASAHKPSQTTQADEPQKAKPLWRRVLNSYLSVFSAEEDDK